MTTPKQHRRLLRTRDDIFAAGYADGLNAKPLTEQQVNALAAIFAPALNASAVLERGAA